MVGGRCWCCLGRRGKFLVVEGGGFLGRRCRCRCRRFHPLVARLLMGLGTRRGWTRRGGYSGSSGFGDRRGMRGRMGRGLALVIGGLAAALGSGSDLWGVRRRDGGQPVGVVVEGRHLMERMLAPAAVVVMAVFAAVEQVLLRVEGIVWVALLEVNRMRLISRAL